MISKEEKESCEKAFRAVASTGLSIREMGDFFIAAARAIANGLESGIAKHTKAHVMIARKARRMTAYQRRAARLNARPRPSKRHGERRGVK